MKKEEGRQVKRSAGAEGRRHLNLRKISRAARPVAASKRQQTPLSTAHSSSSPDYPGRKVAHRTDGRAAKAVRSTCEQKCASAGDFAGPGRSYPINGTVTHAMRSRA